MVGNEVRADGDGERSSSDLEAPRFRVMVELRDFFVALCQQIADVVGRSVSAPQPEDLRWETVDQAALVEVGIERDDYKSVFLSERPNADVVRLIQPKHSDMAGIWKQILEVVRQPVGNVLVEEKLQ